MEKDWQNQLAFDLNACFKAEFVANCISVISEYELNMDTNFYWTGKATEPEEFLTKEEADNLKIWIICLSIGGPLLLALFVYLVCRCVKSWFIPKIEDVIAENFASNLQFNTRQFYKNPEDIKNHVLYEVSMLDHIKKTYAHHANQPERRLYQDIVKTLNEYKKRKQEAMKEASTRVDQNLNRQPERC